MDGAWIYVFVNLTLQLHKGPNILNLTLTSLQRLSCLTQPQLNEWNSITKKCLKPKYMNKYKIAGMIDKNISNMVPSCVVEEIMSTKYGHPIRHPDVSHVPIFIDSENLSPSAKSGAYFDSCQTRNHIIPPTLSATVFANRDLNAAILEHMMYQIMNQNELQGDVKYLIHKVQRYCLGLKPLMCLFASLINNGCESPITTG